MSAFGAEVKNLILPWMMLTISYAAFIVDGFFFVKDGTSNSMYAMIPIMATDAVPLLYIFYMHYINFGSSNSASIPS